jgi:ABC-2 type transport system ATP-binding protein
VNAVIQINKLLILRKEIFIMDENVVVVRNLVKKYGPLTVVSDVSFTVKTGEVFGLLGPNGAGKTTSLECLEGLRRISGGAITIAGRNPQIAGSRLHDILGVQLQASSLPDSITVREALDLFCSWHNVSLSMDLVQRFEMAGLFTKKYKQLSTGQKRRLHLALALVNHPQVVILDEPTAGLDVQSRTSLHEEIRNLKSQGLTIILATHDMAEAEALCDRIAIMIQGKLVVCGTPQEVTAAGNKETRILLHTQHSCMLPGNTVGGARFVESRDGYLEWRSKNIAADVSQILMKVQQYGDAVDDLRVERPSLEERFLELVEGR